MVAGAPQQIGLPTGVGNVSPVTCEGDRVVENGIGAVVSGHGTCTPGSSQTTGPPGRPWPISANATRRCETDRS